jgi:membrane protease YdiL (CAAX protease family)
MAAEPGSFAPPPRITGTFFSSYGLRSGWRFLLWAAIAALAIACGFGALHGVVGKASFLPFQLLAIEGIQLAGAFIATWVLARFIDRKPVTTFGLALNGSAKRFLVGLLCGFASLTFLVGLLALSHAFTLHGLAIHGWTILEYAALWALVFLLVGLSEELITRGYLLFSLTQGIGFWPAAILLAALFAAGHIGNPGENVLGIAAAGFIGLMLAWSLKWTGSLWWAIGFHAAWDWAESYFYGVPDSGGLAPGHLLVSAHSGPAWLSGGSAGPEGSALVFVVIAILAFVLSRIFPSTAPPALHRLRRQTPVVGPCLPVVAEGTLPPF